MTRKEKKARKRLQTTRQLMGIDQFTEYGLKAGKSELVFFLIKPDNLSVLSDEGIRGRVRGTNRPAPQHGVGADAGSGLPRVLPAQ